MNGIKRIFSRAGKERASKGPNDQSMSNISIEHSSLPKLSVAQLCNIIYRYDNDIATMQSSLSIKTHLLTQLQSQLTFAQSQIQKFEVLNQKLSSQLENLKETSREAQDSIDSLESQLQAKNAAAAEKDALVENYQRQITNLAQQLSELYKLERANLSAEDKLELFRIKTEVFVKNQDLSIQQQLKHTNRVLENDIAAVSLQNSQLRFQKNELEHRLERTQDQYQLLEHTLTLAELEINNLQQELASKKQANVSLNFELQNKATKIDTFRKTVQQYEQKLDQKKSKLRANQIQLEKMKVKVEESQYKVFAQCMREREELQRKLDEASSVQSLTLNEHHLTQTTNSKFGSPQQTQSKLQEVYQFCSKPNDCPWDSDNQPIPQEQHLNSCQTSRKKPPKIKLRVLLDK